MSPDSWPTPTLHYTPFDWCSFGFVYFRLSIFPNKFFFFSSTAGLLLVPNGEDLGYFFGDFNPYATDGNTNISIEQPTAPIRISPLQTAHKSAELVQNNQITPHPWGIFFTILGTVLLDFDADACQSPARAYLLDVTMPEDHAKGLSTFTIMAGLGGFMGYSLGGINWDATAIGVALGGHVRAVFTLVTVIFIFCVSATITSFREIPLWRLEALAATKLTTVIEDEHEDQSSSVEDDGGDGSGNGNDVNTKKNTLTIDQIEPVTTRQSTSYGSLQVEQDPAEFVSKLQF